MPLLNVAPTKSNLLSLRRQLAFAEEGYDLLEQKRQILILELMARLRTAQELEDRLALSLSLAYAALRQALLDAGSAALDRAILAIPPAPQIDLATQKLMGLRLPRVVAKESSRGVPLPLAGISSSTELARQRFADLLPDLLALAELQTAVLRLASELRKTQRRCNSLTRIFIPNYRQTIAYITSSLEERDRESFAILKIIRAKLAHESAEIY